MSVCLYFIGHLHGNLIEGYSIKTFPQGTCPPPPPRNVRGGGKTPFFFAPLDVSINLLNSFHGAQQVSSKNPRYDSDYLTIFFHHNKLYCQMQCWLLILWKLNENDCTLYALLPSLSLIRWVILHNSWLTSVQDNSSSEVFHHQHPSLFAPHLFDCSVTG